MTRFARAKGSKASNERLPERATPWSMMRNPPQQDDRQEDASEREKFETMRKQNYENFLKEQAAEKTVKTWCTFEENVQTKNSNPVDSTNIKNSGKSKKKKRSGDSETSSGDKTKEKHKNETIEDNESSEENEEEIDKWLNDNPDEETETKFTDLTSQLENILKSKKTNKKNKSKDNSNSESSFTVTNTIENDDNKIVKKGKKRKRNEASVDNDTSNCVEIPSKVNKTVDAQDTSEKKSKKSKNKTKTLSPEELGVENKKNSDNSDESNRNQKKNKKVNNVNEDSKIAEKSDVPNGNAEKNTNKKQKKNKTKNITAPDERNESKTVQKLDKKSNMPSDNKNKKDFESKRRKPPMEKSILIVNGEQLEVTCFDGFPILTKDAERLQDLRKNLISKGIPRSEVMRTMKLERRKAEKALSRMKKKLCFHCRKGGHNLSECPELNKKSDFGAPSSGICFKCGSTEHTHFACKVVRTQDFKFAQCFICKEQGHISRQCPDNPRGLYPKGGGCRECGDVTHLKKDCPKIVQQKEDTSIKLDLMDHENVEDNKKSAQQVQNSSIKRIKF